MTSERYVQLLGGWGYNNLGDEAILAGYIETFGAESRVRSIDPVRTAGAQRDGVRVEVESGRSKLGSDDLSVICGGGYLNGNWRREVGSKLDRLARLAAGSRRVVHGVEIRRLAASDFEGGARELLSGAAVAVRDEESANEVAALGLPRPEILPDGISLLYPHLSSYVKPLEALGGKVVLNLLDIAARNDSAEAEISLGSWNAFVAEVVKRLGDRAVGMVIGGGDYRFMKRFESLNVVEPTSVQEMVSVLGSARSVLSVRMHPALIATGLSKPVISIPYCGKVRPTLERIGVEEVIAPDLDADWAVEMLLEGEARDFSGAWGSAHRENRDWLAAATS